MRKSVGFVGSLLLFSFATVPLIAFLSASFAAETPVFAPPVELNAGTGPHYVAVGDFNSDTNLDVAVANYGSDNISVLLGAGDGSFGSQSTFPVGDGPFSIAVGDLNRDNKLDLVVPKYGSENAVAVLLGDGAGGFGAATAFAVGAGPRFAAIGDLNNDTKPDIAVACPPSRYISVLFGDGSGGFGSATGVDVGAAHCDVAVTDLNGDGSLDLVSAINTCASVLLGNGSGGFGSPANFALGGAPDSLALGDFNNDGKVDLATSSQSAKNVSVLLGNGAGGFGSATTFSVGGDPHTSLAVGDLNRDGHLDLAIPHYHSSFLSVLLGDGLGGFGTLHSFAAGAGPAGVALGDLNKDSRLDLVAANYDSNNISVLLNTTPAPATTLVTTASPRLVPYGGATALSGSLTDAGGTRIEDHDDVTVWRKPVGGTLYAKETTATYNPAASTYDATCTCTQSTVFQMRHSEDATYGASCSNEVTIAARACLSRPWPSPSIPRRNRRFYVYGYLKPRHSGSTRLDFYRLVSYRRNGLVYRRWRYVGRLYAANYRYNGYTRYRLPLSLHYAGYWRVRAYHSDANHYPTCSTIRTFYVR